MPCAKRKRLEAQQRRKRGNPPRQRWSGPCYGLVGKFGFRVLSMLAATTSAPSAPKPQGDGASTPAANSAIEDRFATILAQTNPEVLQKPVLAQKTVPAKAQAQTLPAKLRVVTTAATPSKPSSKDDTTTTTPSAGVAALAVPAQPAAPLASGTKPFADLRAVDPARLRADLSANTQTPAKPGAPTLPVMPIASGPVDGDQDDESESGETPAPASKEFTATLADTLSAANPPQTTAAAHARPAPPAQTTEALPVRFDASAKQDSQGDNASSGKGSPDGQAGGDQSTASNASPAQPAAHAQPDTPVAAPVAQTNATNANSATLAAGNAASSAISAAQPMAAGTSATLHIAPQSQAATASPQPDLAALAVTIAAKSQEGSKHFDIRLDPPEFGRVDVRLSVDDSGRAQAHLTADKPQTLELLQRDSGTLQRALKDSGVDVGNSGLQFSLRGQDRQGSDGAKQQARGRALSVTAAVAAPTASTVSLAPDSARLDIRV
jgi:flagellar hook-length control protein FliK